MDYFRKRRRYDSQLYPVEKIIYLSKGLCTLCQSFSYVFPFLSFFFFFVSYENPCYRCENAENRTWYDFFMRNKSFRGNVHGQMQGHICFFNVQKFQTKNSDSVLESFSLSFIIVLL